MTSAPRLFAVLLVLGALAGCSTTTKGSGSAVLSSSVARPSAASSSASTTAAAPSPSAAPSTSVAPVPTKPLRTETITGNDAVTKYVIAVWVQDDTVNCENHAYGAPVIAYLKANLCTGMRRLLAATTVGGRPVGIAQSLVSFNAGTQAGEQAAGDFQTLVTQNGTGNINDLLREGKRFPNSGSKVGEPDAFVAAHQDGGVGIDDVWYLDGPTPDNDPPLLALAQSLFLQLS